MTIYFLSIKQGKMKLLQFSLFSSLDFSPQTLYSFFTILYSSPKDLISPPPPPRVVGKIRYFIHPWKLIPIPTSFLKSCRTGRPPRCPSRRVPSPCTRVIYHTGWPIKHGGVFFWYLVNSDLSSVLVNSSLHRTNHFLKGFRNTGHL